MSLNSMTSWTILARDTDTGVWFQFATGGKDLKEYGQLVEFAVYKANDGFDVDAIIIKQDYPGNIRECIFYPANCMPIAA